MEVQIINELAQKSIDQLKHTITCAMPHKYEAIKALSKINTDESRKTLRSLLLLDDAYIKRFVLEELGNIESKETLAKIISNVSKDKNEFLRRTSLSIIEKQGITSLHGFVAESLKSQDPLTLEYALNAINQVWSDDDFTAIMELSKKEQNQDIKKRCYEILCNHASASNWQSVYKIIRTNKIPQIRLLACKLLTDNFSDEFMSDIQGFAKDKDGHIRKLAANYLKEIISA
ncbi:MAG: HEAT repeat domain-containing protein [Treponema sp.]|nr:HEAT repeat domain-containing protein [Treponema sp.]